MTTRYTHFIEGLGELEIEAHFMPAEPDVGIFHPYIDELFIYYPMSDVKIGDKEYESITPEEMDEIEKGLMRHLSEQAALAQAYRLGKVPEDFDG